MSALSIARPYAKAAFDYAVEQDAVAEWAEFLGRLADVVASKAVTALLSQPGLDSQKMKAFLMAATALDSHAGGKVRYLHLLVDNRRVGVSPEVLIVFNAMKAAHERRLRVTLTTAKPIDQGQQERLAAVLNKRYQRDIEIHTQVDETLLGGAIIRVGDQVTDGSLKYKLSQLAIALKG